MSAIERSLPALCRQLFDPNAEAAVLAALRADSAFAHRSDERQRLPIHWGALFCSEPVVSASLEAGANVDAVDSGGMAPIRLVGCSPAARSPDRVIAVTRSLLAAGAHATAEHARALLSRIPTERHAEVAALVAIAVAPDRHAGPNTVDIRSRREYPGCELSNLTPHAFVFRGVALASMEGLLQGLKHSDPAEQQRVFGLSGPEARTAGYPLWQDTDTLYWRGRPFKRTSREYQDLLDEAYKALYTQNTEARAALLATGDAQIRHSLGKHLESQTVLTEREFCSRLMQIRDKLRART